VLVLCQYYGRWHLLTWMAIFSFVISRADTVHLDLSLTRLSFASDDCFAALNCFIYLSAHLFFQISLMQPLSSTRMISQSKNPVTVDGLFG
jgi:hypothetical protein